MSTAQPICFRRVSDLRVTRWVQQWAKVRRSGHCVHRPVLTLQLRILRARNGVESALDFRDRILRIGAYPMSKSFWAPGKTGPDFWQYRPYSTTKLDNRRERNNVRFWCRGAGVRL